MDFLIRLTHSLVISGKEILDEHGIPDQILQWRNDPSCFVNVYPFDPKYDIWQDIALRKPFKLFYDCLLERFEILTRRLIVDSFSRIMLMFSAEQDINIAIKNRQWVNEEFFASTEDAAYYYRLAMHEMIDHFSAVLGSRLLASNLREVFASLLAGYREILQKNTILPEGYFS